jgi:acetoin:2,6-dichlorophenolindophenol oxidoreductase subunit alpha
MTDHDLLLVFLEKMLLIRSFEYKLYELAKKGIVRGSVHFCIGEEAAAVGTCMAIDSNDYIMPTHRGHGQELVTGSDPGRLLAEIIGKETGLCKGRSGTMHIFDKKHNNLGAQGILGAQFPIAVGVGLAIKLKDLKNTVVVCFFGDGTTNLGNFYEGLNIAALWSLPIIFVCNNNVYGMGTRYDETCKTEIYKKAEMFDIYSTYADGNNVEEVYYKMKDIVSIVKKDLRPAFFELRTYRIWGHSAFDNRPYRTKEEIESWQNRDPIDALEKKLSPGSIDPKEIDSIKEKVKGVILAAEKFALESSYPEYDISLEQ